MMKQVFRFDKETGVFIEPVILRTQNEGGSFEIPTDCTEIELPQPNWKPIWDGEKWWKLLQRMS